MLVEDLISSDFVVLEFWWLRSFYLKMGKSVKGITVSSCRKGTICPAYPEACNESHTGDSPLYPHFHLNWADYSLATVV